MSGTYRVLHAASECYPLAKTGGLGDVVAALPAALRRSGCDARIALPAYRGLHARIGHSEVVARFAVNGVGFTVLKGQLPDGVPLYLFDAPALFDRPGTPYQDAAQRDFADNAFRFGCFSAALAGFVQQGAAGFAPELVHLHDWQTGLAATSLAEAPQRPGIVFTIHNLAYQGQFGRAAFDALQLPARWWTPERLEFWGTMSCMKGGLMSADAITTVSPRYAKEILTPAFGCGLEGVLQSRAATLSGIVNGIDTEVWNPSRDGYLSTRYTARTVKSGKRANRLHLSQQLGLDEQAIARDQPLLVFIGRLAHQKGADLLLQAGPDLLTLPLQIAVLASGDLALESGLRAWAAHAPTGKVVLRLAHSEALAHQLTAAADFVLMPSRFEPCGLNQLYAQAYGAIPIVHRTGGLADTVVDATDSTLADGSATGVHFEHADAAGLLWGVQRGCKLFADAAIRKNLQKAGMRRDSSWAASAQEYLQVYSRIHR